MRVSICILLAFVVTAGVAFPAPSPMRGSETVARAAAGEAEAAAAIEERLSPLFERKDLDMLTESAVAREVVRLLGLEAGPAPAVLWRGAPGPGGPKLLAIDFGGPSGQGGAAPSGYVAYAIVERPPAESSAKASPAWSAWYHDTGRKLAEQGGEPWHPLAAEVLGGERPGEKRSLAVAEAVSAGGPAVGVLVLDSLGEGRWSASRRISPAPALRGARLLAVGEGGAVFLAPREAPKGVLTGAPADLFRSLVLYERRSGAFADEPVVSALPDSVTAAEALLAAVRRGDKAAAASLCRSPDVLESLLYFSPAWKGGGRVVTATPAKVEFHYEEQGRPPLRIELTFANVGGSFLLVSAAGRSDDPS